MSFSLADLSRLRASLAVVGSMAVLGGAAVIYSHDRIAAAQRALATAQAERNEIDGKFRQVRSEEIEIRQKAAVLDRLAARGMIGEEDRLEWIELLNEIRDRRRLPEVHYEFAPQRALDEAPDPAQPGTFGLYASAMKLQARLLHEEDLIRFFDDLREYAPALIQVKRCDVSRLAATDTSDALQGLLQADCLIDWITLRAAGGSAENAQ